MGMLAGNISVERLEFLGRYVVATGAAYCAYLYLGRTISEMYLGQMLGAIIALALIFGLSCRIPMPMYPRQHLIRLGQYSLVAYIAQIGFLQILSRVVPRPDTLSLGAAFLFTATLFLTTAWIGLTAWARLRSDNLDKVYKAIFA